MTQPLAPISPVAPVAAVPAISSGSVPADSPKRISARSEGGPDSSKQDPAAANAPLPDPQPGSDALSLLPGKASFAVKWGERILGFSREEVRSIQVKAQNGTLHLQMLASDGRTLGEIRALGPEQLKQQLHQLSEAGIAFQAKQSKELVDLMKLTMAGGVSRTELLLLIDEVGHLAPQNAPVAVGLDPATLFPELSLKVKELLAAMPEEIQRTVLLHNREHIPRETWDALALAAKTDRSRDAALARFLEGRGPLNFEAEAQLKTLTQRQSLETPKPIEKLDPEAFLQLVERLRSQPPAKSQGQPQLSAAVTRFAIQHFELDVPDFASEPSFDQLARKIELKSKSLETEIKKLTLEEFFKKNLDTTKYKKLSEFLSGQPDAKMDTEVLAEAVHLLKHPNEAPSESLSSVAAHSLERLTRALKATSPQLEPLIEAQSKLTQGIENQPTSEQLEKYQKLANSEKLALFVIDHINPMREPNLYLYFDGKNRLSKITPAMQDELLQFLGRETYPRVDSQLMGLETDKVQDLVQRLARFPERSPPADYLPHKEPLLELMQRLAGERAGERLAHKDHQLANQSEIALLDRLLKIPEQAQGSSEEGRNLLLSQTLRRYSPRFAELSLLDQILGSVKVMKEIQASQSLNLLPELGLRIRALTETARGQVPESQSWSISSEESLESLEFKNDPEKVLKKLRNVLDKTLGMPRVAELERFLVSEGRELLGDSARRSLSARLENWLRGMSMVRDKGEMLARLGEGSALLKGFIGEVSHSQEERIATFEAGLKGLDPKKRQEKIGAFLRENLAQFRRVAMLDQLWRVERLTQELPRAGSGLPQVTRELAHSLHQLAKLLEDREQPDLHWELLDRPAAKPAVSGGGSSAIADHKPDFKEMAMREPGLKRYFKMDESLPERAPKLADRLEELGLLKRVQGLAERVEELRLDNVGELLDTLGKQQGLLKRLVKLALEGDVHEWSFLSKSPLTAKKERQFQEVREQVLTGVVPDLDPLFEAPFLRGEYGDAAAKQHEQELARLEPALKAVVKRAFEDPERRLSQLLQSTAGQGAEQESKLRESLEQFRSFNQQQNLNQLPLYMGFPLAMKGQKGQFEMAYLPLTKSKKRDRFMVVLHLDFEDWGHLRVDAVKEQGKLHATFWAENHKMHRLLLHELHRLEDRMEELSMGEVEFQTKLSAAKASQSLADLCQPPENALDLSI